MPHQPNTDLTAILEKRNGHWTLDTNLTRITSYQLIPSSNGRTTYMLRMEDGAMVARLVRHAPIETSYGERSVRTRVNHVYISDNLPETGTVLIVGNRVGYLTWFGGTPRYDGNNVDGGVIHKVYVSSTHRRKGVATAMLNRAQELHPQSDIRHSNALSDDGVAWAAATPTARDLTAHNH